MSEQYNGFSKAQREYENQLPPEGPNSCQDCDGTGKVSLSNCCGADVDDDILICPACKEHCDVSDCDTCDGTGLDQSAIKQQEAYEEYLENKAEEHRLDRLMEQDQSVQKVGSDIDRFLEGRIEE